MSELVTGEAVALELRPARLPSRALAVLLDLAVAVAVYVAVTVALVASTASLDAAAQTAVSIAAFVLVLVGVPVAVETLSHGRSLGKMACGLRVVRDDGGPIRFRHALVRGLIGVIEILVTFGVVACIASLVSARGRRIGDVFAGTLVVRERVAVSPAAFVPPPPPWLAGRFSGLDLSAVPDGLWLAVRQYLTRMQQLDPQVAWAMAERLAADVAARTGAPAPQDVPPAAYLAAVVQERQAREARRAFGSGAGPSGAAPGGGAGGGAMAWAAPGPAAAGSPVPGSAAPVRPDVRDAGYGAPAGAAGGPGEAAAGGGGPAVPREPGPAERPVSGFVPPA
ncbi:RDD family protein [Streptomyces leeuwenhoekii]|uniref:RDD Domain-Containing Protein n=1 Tax=Streptomyces leeuwenhoekii TaxID=1437453 RepID=A0A0F7VT87_STRLW|nr:RDD family protein [Streptomyces leeuwenhoekii]CQR63719.1 RDD Domain-Containing Protein [Streptomyces leeuwenhoekii]